MSSTYKQYLRARSEVISSMTNAKNIRDQWLAATTENPVNLTKKEVDHIGKAFKNRLLTVKWDCEDLEELVNVSENESNGFRKAELDEAKQFIDESKTEISKMVDQLENEDSINRLYNKHSISQTHPSTTQTTTLTSSQSPNSTKYNLVSANDVEEIRFDKYQVETSATVFNNALYDHYEQTGSSMHSPQQKTFSPSQVFNNLSRPVTNVYMNPNENEIILNMLETEYYNPPSGLQTRPKYNYMIRKLFENDRNRVLGAIAFIFSFPILLLLFIIV